jgi:hypothetical protein
MCFRNWALISGGRAVFVGMAQGMGKWEIHSESSEILQKTDYFSLIPCFLQKFDFTWQLAFIKLIRVGLSKGF